MEPDQPEQPILVDNGARRLTLDELGHSQPGMARLMAEIGTRIWKAWYAAEARNWPLARWQLNQAMKLLDQSAFVRPKYQASMGKFLTEDFQPLRTAVDATDWGGLRDVLCPDGRAGQPLPRRLRERLHPLAAARHAPARSRPHSSRLRPSPRSWRDRQP